MNKVLNKGHIIANKPVVSGCIHRKNVAKLSKVQEIKITEALERASFRDKEMSDSL